MFFQSFLSSAQHMRQHAAGMCVEADTALQWMWHVSATLVHEQDVLLQVRVVPYVLCIQDIIPMTEQGGC
jgi:hypothetical protein